MIEGIINVLGSPLGKWIISAGFCVCMVGVIEYIKMLIENMVNNDEEKSEKAIDILTRYVYPLLPIPFSVLLSLLWKVDEKFLINLIYYIGVTFLVYKIGYRMIIDKIRSMLK